MQTQTEKTQPLQGGCRPVDRQIEQAVWGRHALGDAAGWTLTLRQFRPAGQRRDLPGVPDGMAGIQAQQLGHAHLSAGVGQYGCQLLITQSGGPLHFPQAHTVQVQLWRRLV